MDYLTSLFGNAAGGLAQALTFGALLYAFIGVTLGQLLGALPGIGTLVAMSLLFPITFYLEPLEALVMLAGIYYGTAYGGSTASILLSLPGTPQNAVTCLDGYPMSKQGRAGVALFMTTAGSFFGGSIGIILMMLFSPVIAANALQFASAEYFSLMLMGLVAASTVSTGAPIKGLAMTALGISLGFVGIDVHNGQYRFTFGFLELWDGLGLVALAMGLFGVTEVIASVRRGEASIIDARSVTLRSLIPTRDDVRRSWLPMIRGTAIGAFFGTLPGTGATLSAFMSYAIERKVSKEPERFGNGAIEGVVGPETANNASDQTAFIPTLTLGIPGSASMALIIGALMIHGYSPGPRLVTDSPEIFWGLVMSFWIGNLMLVILNIPFIGIWVRLLTVPYHFLYPAVLAFVCMGVFAVESSHFDVWLVLVFGIVGYVMRLLDFPMAPLLLGYVLGPLIEENFRRSLLLSGGDFVIFVERPISGTLMAITAVLLVWAAVDVVRSTISEYSALARN